jgi:trk system potassium uptake protein TrkA
VVGKAIEDIDLPEGATIGAILREADKNNRVIIAHDDTIIKSGDHVIVFMVDRKQTKHVEKLFQVGFSFF